MKKRICKGCEEEFPKTEEYFLKTKNQYGSYLSPYCIDCYRLISGKKKHLIIKKGSTALNPHETTSEQTQKREPHLNGLNGDLKAITLYKELSQKICLLMRKNRIMKYGINTQNLILDLMEACYKHLNNELNKKEVIDVDWSK